MKVRNIVLLLFLAVAMVVDGQVTYNPNVESRNNSCNIESVTLTETNTIVKIRVPKYYAKKASISSATVLVPIGGWPISSARKANLDARAYPDIMAAMSSAGYLIRGLGEDKLDRVYRIAKGFDSFCFTMYFDRLPPGAEKVYIRELKTNGWEWFGVRINNPYPAVEKLDYDEVTLKAEIDRQDDDVVGVYQCVGKTDRRYTLGCIRTDSVYKMVYLDSKPSLSQWKVGEVKAVLHPTAVSTMLTADWRMDNKTVESGYAVLGRAMMEMVVGGNKDMYIKIYPTTSRGTSSGTGFLLSKDGYVITNSHVVEGAKSIEISGIGEDVDEKYMAKVVVDDKQNDLVILKIMDVSFTALENIPYAFKFAMADVGESCFVLGYPMPGPMGTEIKLTNGIVSSKTGFEGSVAQYQISAPVQPGNSGGPLFDSEGNVIGVIEAKLMGAENVGYAIKASYIKQLIELLPESIDVPSAAQMKGKPLPQQAELAAKAICRIMVKH